MNILLIEDNIGDVYLIQAALDDIGLEYNLNTLHNGEAAISRIQNTEDMAIPDLILLDINIPRKNGFEVLQELKNSEALRDVPVIIITSVMSDEDKDTARKLGAAGFISKPQDYNEYAEQVKTAVNYFMN